MAKEREDKLDPTRPTLIVQHGNTPRKYRRLEKEVLVLGRAPGCDLSLEAPEVAPVHCVIVRAADGWRVRDCTGRGGTRLNGSSVQDAVLCDEDVLQVGSFSFAFHLPPERRPAIDAGRLQRSRQSFARLALRLRGRLRKAAAEVAARVEERLAARQDELDRQAEELDALRNDLDARIGEMRRTRQEIAEESVALIKRHERVEKELAERQAEHERADAESAGDAPRRLEIRARELGHYADTLRRGRRRLDDHEKILAARRAEWLHEQQEASAQHARQIAEIAREETLLREQRSEVVRLMSEMRQPRRRPDADTPRQENERLHRTLAERDSALAAAREEARQRSAEAEELRGRMEAEAAENRLGAAALRQFPFELEEDRRSLEDQILGIQGRYAELEQAAREAELQIVRERERIAQGREGLELVRQGLRQSAEQSPTKETVVDMPSPLHHFAEPGPRPEPCDAMAEAGTHNRLRNLV